MINFRVFFSKGFITNAFLTKVANNLGNTYYQLGMLLSVAAPLIQRLENDYLRNTWRITYEMLVNWRETSVNRSNAVFMAEDLIAALTELNLNDVAEIVRHGECRTGPWHPFYIVVIVVI